MDLALRTHPRHWDAVVHLTLRHGPIEVVKPTRRWRGPVGWVREAAIVQLRPDLRAWDVAIALEVEPRRAPASAERLEREEVRPDLRAWDVAVDRMEARVRAERETRERQRRTQAHESAVTAVGFFVGLVLVYALLLLYGEETPNWISDWGLVALAVGFVAFWVVVDVVAAAVHWLLWTRPRPGGAEQLESRGHRTPERSAHRRPSGSRHRRGTALTGSCGRGNRAPKWYSW